MKNECPVGLRRNDARWVKRAHVVRKGARDPDRIPASRLVTVELLARLTHGALPAKAREFELAVDVIAGPCCSQTICFVCLKSKRARLRNNLQLC